MKISIRTLFIFSDLIESLEENSNGDEKLLFYYPATDDLRTKVRHLGLADALIKFTKSFKPQYKYEAVYTKQTRQLFFEAEPNYWIVLIIDLPQIVIKKSNEDDFIDYCDDNIHDNVLNAFVELSYNLFRFSTGTFHSNFEKFQIHGLRRICELFYNEFISSMDSSNYDIMTVLSGVHYLPLDNLTFLNIQCFNNTLQIRYPFIDHMSFFYKDSLIWNGIENNNISILYVYLINILFPSIKEKFIEEVQKARKTILKNNIPGQFLLLKDEVEHNCYTNLTKKVYFLVDNEETIFNMIIYRKVDTTLCLFIKEETNLKEYQIRILEEFLDVQLTPLINSITDYSTILETKDTNNDSTFTQLNDIPYLYFNHINLAITTSMFSEKKLVHDSTKIPKEVLNEIQALNLKYFISEKIEDTYFKEIIVQMNNCDYWIIYKICMLRELFILLKRKDITMLEAIDDSKKVYQSQLKGIFFHH